MAIAEIKDLMKFFSPMPRSVNHRLPWLKSFSRQVFHTSSGLNRVHNDSAATNWSPADGPVHTSRSMAGYRSPGEFDGSSEEPIQDHPEIYFAPEEMNNKR